VEDEQALHDAPGAAEHLAKIKRFALWLKSEMVNKGLAPHGPDIDEGGWTIDVPSNGGGFVYCIVSGSRGDVSLFELLVTEIGSSARGRWPRPSRQYSAQCEPNHGVESRLRVD
jgi:hypothetical protein